MQIMNATSWTSFKSLVTSKQLLIQYSEIDNYYDIYAPEAGAFLWHVIVYKDGGTDVTDFETHYKATANAPLEIKAATGRPDRISVSPQPLGTYNKWKGFQIVMEPGMTHSFLDLSWPTQIYFRGGYLYTSSDDPGDYISADVLMNPGDAVLMPSMIQNVYTTPGVELSFLSDESMLFPTYMKLRVHCYCPEGLSETQTRYFNIMTEYFQ
jgi:hypothetical protein